MSDIRMYGPMGPTQCSRVCVHVFACSRNCVYGVFSRFPGAPVFTCVCWASGGLPEHRLLLWGCVSWPDMCLDSFHVFPLCLAVCLRNTFDLRVSPDARCLISEIVFGLCGPVFGCVCDCVCERKIFVFANFVDTVFDILCLRFVNTCSASVNTETAVCLTVFGCCV